MNSVECVIPILCVRNLAASMRFYTALLGFKLDWSHPSGGPATFASVSRDGHSLMLCEQGQGEPGTWLWIGVEDIDPLYAELGAKGVKIAQSPTDYEWAREMRIEDPDGHVLRFGSGPKEAPSAA